ncbi:hypothetical protein AOLI_G00265260 [Acnodon oligacanthus]
MKRSCRCPALQHEQQPQPQQRERADGSAGAPRQRERTTTREHAPRPRAGEEKTTHRFELFRIERVLSRSGAGEQGQFNLMKAPPCVFTGAGSACAPSTPTLVIGSLKTSASSYPRHVRTHIKQGLGFIPVRTTSIPSRGAQSAKSSVIF